jgi:hypothetical protein
MHKSTISHWRLLLATVIFMGITFQKSLAQTTDYKNNPEWIKMIDNPNANYYEAIKAYETYWNYHEKPKGEEEEMEMNAGNSPTEKMTDKEKKEREEFLLEKERQREKDANHTFTEKEMKALAEKQEMTYQCKRFENWILEVKPFVQNDGRILSQEERLKIYNDQIEEQRKQNNK